MAPGGKESDRRDAGGKSPRQRASVMKARGEQPRNDVADLGLTDARRLRLLVDAFTDCAIYMLDPRGFVTSWSAGAEAIKGYGSAEITGRHFSIFFTPEDRAQGVPERT